MTVNGYINTLETYDKVNDADMNITGTIIKLFIDVKQALILMMLKILALKY